jgi:eukaryotic-like serine/threonine-protein kinase
MDLDLLEIDDEIKHFIKNQNDVIIDKYSDSGCNGELFFGMHKIFKERVALKFYYVDKYGLSHKEPQILRKIDHTNVIKIHDARIIGANYAYFLTPQIKGGDLFDYKNNTILDTHTALKIVQDILLGLSEMHKVPNRLLHRDLKPNNILIDENRTAIIADFGSVKHIPSDKQNIVASKNSMVYRAKEVVEKGEYCFQSDIYQVGIILFQLLGGFFPDAIIDWLDFKKQKKAIEIKDMFEQHVFIEKQFDKLISSHKLIRFDSLAFYIDDRLKGIIRKATNPILSQRYKNTSEFYNAIYKYKAKAVNWVKVNDEYIATCHNNTEYRIYPDNKGFQLERKVKNGVPRNFNKHNGSIDAMIEIINSEK